MCLLLANTTLAAEPLKSVPLSMQDREPDKKVLPDKGHRMPAYISCTIDFAAGSIESSIASPILSYELWDEEGETILASYATDHELVDFMATLTGAYQLRLVTDEYLYIGYLEL